MSSSTHNVRILQELKMLSKDPPPGVSVFSEEDQMSRLKAQMVGPEESPYEEGVYDLSVIIPERYPFEPPKVQFLTPVYHPNVDDGGRICLDALKMPPQGSWKPSLNIATVLTSIRLLLSAPNPDDGLMADISKQFMHDRAAFEASARQHCRKHAVPKEEGEELTSFSVSTKEPQASSEKGDKPNEEKDEETPLNTSSSVSSPEKRCSPSFPDVVNLLSSEDEADDQPPAKKLRMADGADAEDLQAPAVHLENELSESDDDE